MTAPTTTNPIPVENIVGNCTRHAFMREKMAMIRTVAPKDMKIPPTPISPAEIPDRIWSWLGRE
jgi:Ni,Fe-hydrogenase III small subunit